MYVRYYQKYKYAKVTAACQFLRDALAEAQTEQQRFSFAAPSLFTTSLLRQAKAMLTRVQNMPGFRPQTLINVNQATSSSTASKMKLRPGASGNLVSEMFGENSPTPFPTQTLIEKQSQNELGYIRRNTQTLIRDYRAYFVQRMQLQYLAMQHQQRRTERDLKESLLGGAPVVRMKAALSEAARLQNSSEQAIFRCQDMIGAIEHNFAMNAVVECTKLEHWYMKRATFLQLWFHFFFSLGPRRISKDETQVVTAKPGYT
jgi:hypothetical protein